MYKDALYLEPLQKAVISLHKVLEQPKDEFIRDATMQHFSSTYDLS